MVVESLSFMTGFLPKQLTPKRNLGLAMYPPLTPGRPQLLEVEGCFCSLFQVSFCVGKNAIWPSDHP